MNRVSFALSFVILFSFWILLSGFFDFIHLFLGAICTFLVAWISHNLLIGEVKDLKLAVLRVLRFLAYLPWLLYQIMRANIDIAYRTLHPKMPISPGVIRFKTDLKTEMGMVTLANSITLTPGTVTIDIVEGEYFVHALAKEFAEGLLTGKMQARVKKIEGD